MPLGHTPKSVIHYLLLKAWQSMNTVMLFVGVVAISRKLPVPLAMKAFSSFLVAALLQIAGPLIAKSAIVFSPISHPPTVSNSEDCLAVSSSASQNLTETLILLQAQIPPPQAQENCDTTEKLFREYPNVELAYFNASLIFPPTVLPTEVLDNCTEGVPQLITGNLTETLKETIERLAFGGASCPDIAAKYPSARSGWYTIQDGSGDDVTVYCDMDGMNCDGHPGWMRIGFTDMLAPGAKCPSGLNTIQSFVRKYCGWSKNEAGCASALFDPLGHNYTHVCGRVKAFQHGIANAFLASETQSQGLDGWYVDGVSFTHGSSPRSHIWTYAAGMSEIGTNQTSCPCNAGFSHPSLPPSFVQDDYYCESGNPEADATNNKLYSLDYLWDRLECDGLEHLCCVDPKLPWFTKTLAQSTQDDVELRVCASGQGATGIYLEQLEVLVR